MNANDNLAFELESNTEIDEDMVMSDVNSNNIDVNEQPNIPDPDEMLYCVDENPPILMSIFLGFQQFLVAFGGNLTAIFALAPSLCIPDDSPAISYLIASTFFTSGISTILQCLCGIRLPVVQGVGLVYVVPTLAILNLNEWKCPQLNNTSQYPPDLWKTRMREIQGALIVTSLFEAVIALTGFMGLLHRVITPLTIAPTISLVGLALFPVAANTSGEHWGIALMTLTLVVVFSLYFRNIKVPFPSYSKQEKLHVMRIPMFSLFSVLFAILISWFICYILTITNVLTPDSTIRTDKSSALEKTPWAYIPYPGQWGFPTFSLATTSGIAVGLLSNLIQTTAAYRLYSKVCKISALPSHAVDRGIFINALSSILSGVIGPGVGISIFSQCAVALGITKVCSRRIMLVNGLYMILFGIVCKFGAIFIALPKPILGGLFFAVFGMIAGVGLSVLQSVNMKSSRNTFIIGVSFLLGMGIPFWFKSRASIIIVDGHPIIDQLFRVILSSEMLIGGLLGFFLDNTVPGTDEERGIVKHSKAGSLDGELQTMSVYDLPVGMSFIKRLKWMKKVPISPTFSGFNFGFRSKT